MNPFPTVEIRWFGRGPIPAAVQQWYDALAAPGAPHSPRTDHYLSGTGPALGVKLREGRVEMKQRSGEPGHIDITNAVRGAVEAWRKWSFALENVSTARAAADASPAAWIAVHKRRTLKQYGLDERGAVWPGLVGAPAICEVELTSVGAAGSRWWTIGLESSGRSDLRPRALLAVAGRIFAGADDLLLPTAASYGYARWLEEPAGSSYEEE